MSIASEITRISNNIAAAYTALDGKGATLPETQNSANLADTIDTITTGGGGGGGGSDTPDYMEDYNTMVSTLDTDISNNVTFSNCENNGYTKIGTESASDKLCGAVIDKNEEFMYVRKDFMKAYKIPSTATYESINTTYSLITFGSSNNPHWICYITSSSYNLEDQLKRNCIRTTSTGSSRRDVVKVKCFYLAGASSSLELGQIIMNSGQYNDSIEYIKLPENTTITLGNTSSGQALYNAEWLVKCFAAIFKLRNASEFLSHLSGYSNDLFTLSTSFLDTNCQGGRYNLIPYIKTGTPIVLNMSNVTTTGTFEIFGADSNNKVAKPNTLATDLKIVLPSTYSTINFYYFDYNNYQYSYPFSKEALTYMANNAPTVSSKTINFGQEISGWLNYTTEGQVIKAVFTGKGWTVA